MRNLNPAAHAAAISALEAQRAAYLRYAKMVDAQRIALGVGDSEKLTSFTTKATGTLSELEHGLDDLQPTLAVLRTEPDTMEARELRRLLDAVAREAKAAEEAIQKLNAQLEAWRDDVRQQLTDMGEDAPGSASRPSYGPIAKQRPYLLDRTG